MTLPGVSVLDAAFALSVSAASMVSGNVIGAALSLLVAALYFIASAYIADRRAETKP